MDGILVVFVLIVVIEGMESGAGVEDASVIEADGLTGSQGDFEVDFVSMLKEGDEGVEGGDEFGEGLGPMMVREDERGLEGRRIIDGNQGVQELRWPPDESVDGRLRLQLDRRVSVKRVVVVVLVFEANRHTR